MNEELRKFVNDLPVSCQVSSAVELGSGSGDDARYINQSLGASVVTIDKFERLNDDCTRQITGDYLNSNLIDNLGLDSVDLLIACYTLCFNKRQALAKALPLYFGNIRSGGYIYILDFSTSETVVTKRTNIDDDWFFDLCAENGFDLLSKKISNVYEQAHKHRHQTIELIFKKH